MSTILLRAALCIWNECWWGNDWINVVFLTCLPVTCVCEGVTVQTSSYHHWGLSQRMCGEVVMGGILQSSRQSLSPETEFAPGLGLVNSCIFECGAVEYEQVRVTYWTEDSGESGETRPVTPVITLLSTQASNQLKTLRIVIAVWSWEKGPWSDSHEPWHASGGKRELSRLIRKRPKMDSYGWFWFI